MKIQEVHATLTTQVGSMFHVRFNAKFSDTGEPLTNLRNDAIKALSEKWPQYWEKRKRLEVYRHDDNGEEVIIHVIQKE